LEQFPKKLFVKKTQQEKNPSLKTQAQDATATATSITKALQQEHKASTCEGTLVDAIVHVDIGGGEQ